MSLFRKKGIRLAQLGEEVTSDGFVRAAPLGDDGYVRILRVKNGAVWARGRSGREFCAHCPFACPAAGEPCEFTPEEAP